jgi:hypothetical protein
MNARRALFLLLALAALASCQPAGPADPVSTAAPAPTSNSLFLQRPTATVRPTRTPTPTASATVAPETTAGSATAEASSPTAGPASGRTVVATIYDDSLDPAWTMDPSDEMEIERLSEPVHDGVFSLGVTPTNDFGMLFFAVERQGSLRFPRDQVEALSFWLHGGDNFIPLDALAVTVLGSNANPYWDEDDKSVTNTVRPIFAETRLYFLNLNENIPPNTWVEIIIYLDDLIYDPPYEWVTGVYIKNDQNYLETFYIDNVRLIMTEDGTR